MPPDDKSGGAFLSLIKIKQYPKAFINTAPTNPLSKPFPFSAEYQKENKMKRSRIPDLSTASSHTYLKGEGSAVGRRDEV